MRTLSKDEIRKFVLDNPKYFNLQPHEADYRLGKYNNNQSVKEIQLMFINEIYQPLSNKELKYLKPYVLKANKKLLDALRPFNLQNKKVETIIIKSKDGFDWGMPHTKADVIIIPENKIKAENIDRTIAHEKLHIYQRKFPEVFKKYYKEEMNFHPIKLNDKQLDGINEIGLDKMIITNPDTIDMGNMAYQEKYIPFTVIMPESKEITNVILELKPDGIILRNNNSPTPSYDKIELDHPNEMVAYSLCR
jgi:hypothetical protein